MPLTPCAGGVFSQAWVDGLKHVPELGMQAKIELYTLEKGAYDPATNTYTNNKTMHYAGKARVQPLRSAVPRIVPNDSTLVQTVLISMPIDKLLGVDIRPQMQVRVTEAPLNPSLTRYQYVVKEIIDSSNPLERTILTEVNEEVVG